MLPDSRHYLIPRSQVGCEGLVLLCFFVLLGGVVRVGCVSGFNDVDGVMFAGKHDKVWV
ncbi:hypothetical protein CHLRE_37g759947v5 [Chlamydomonas reinhardtii]|uniref:Uncharacterized protein n=1 Tax=Chlamydomonas reinhardtii TaxID=3055 RepID=A0A2K3CMV1_CHLRE|nr:uncharacterized protein CHLRE_37g759947v5 [Chlamydomonas reinhardtii]PNW69609.1 hypothetical protein CHLRE_37g759947v5 [Chlamydomonas reinhardtii]